jgi:hypothetical protein
VYWPGEGDRVFELRHAMLLRLCIYAAAFGVYFFDPDDVVWRFIRDFPSRRVLEHVAFLTATILIGMGAYLCTRGDAYARSRRAGLAGEWLYVGLSALAPLWGCVALIAGESLRILRLAVACRGGSERCGSPEVGLFASEACHQVGGPSDDDRFHDHANRPGRGLRHRGHCRGVGVTQCVLHLPESRLKT